MADFDGCTGGDDHGWLAREVAARRREWEACANCGNARRFHPVGEPYNCDEFATKVEQVNDAG